ncbi:MAG: glycosyltransferase [Crocinitomicaceae bacterium]|nr:glycosyltransferase [Crocinitomicaceae bacterium]MDG1734605.1 glycosyltransferase [Crocinitomicaceae bacterium]
MFWFNSFLGAYICFLLCLLLSYVYGENKRKKPKKLFDRIALDEITVVIPFRNEYTNLKHLLKQIKSLKTTPRAFIFIDDHSSDNGAKLFEALHRTDIKYLSLSSSRGKKQAIYMGVGHATTKYILSWDADISISSHYFEEITQLEKQALTILPVKFSNTSFYDWFFEIDIDLASYMNHSFAAVKRPLLCSGANLLFEKESYTAVINLEEHQHIPSGDDAFLLRNMQRAKKTITLHALDTCAVTTPNPSNINTFLEQRQRWFGKTLHLKDSLLNTFGIIQFMFAIGFFIILIVLLSNDPLLFLEFWLLKSVLETVLLFPFFKALKKTKLLTILPLYGLLFPIYNVILLASIFRKSEWKGRRI